MKKLAFTIVLSLLFIACDENVIYEKHIDPSGNLEWNKDEVVKHDIEIIDTSIKYNIDLALRYAVGYAYTECKVIVAEVSPSGVVSESEFTFKTRDDKGYVGEAGGDIIDLELPWKKEFKYSEKGIYHYEIRQNMQDPKIHMVMEVGMIVEKIPSEINQQ